jgi:uncharacterized RDD family membrane protein YckC
MDSKIIPMAIEGIDDNIYSTFLSRLGANILDLLIFLLFALLLIFINSFGRNANLFTVALNIAVILCFNVYLPKRFGGTPGKIILGLKIVKLDSSPIGYKEAFFRSIVEFGMALASNAMIFAALLLIDAETFNHLSRHERLAYISSTANTRYFQIFTNIWVWGELIAMLSNKRRRSIHDFIAGTVIVKSKYAEKIRAKMRKEN